MKILILANNDSGVFKFRKELIEELVKKKNQIYVSVPEGDFIDAINELGCKVVINDYMDRRGTKIRRDLRLFRYYVRLIKEMRPDIVLTYTIKPSSYGGIACRLLNIPYIVNVTGLGTSIENGGILRLIALTSYRLGLKKARKVFFQNTGNRDYMVNHHIVEQEKSEILPGSGVNIEQYSYEPYPESDEKLVLTTIGRIMKDKGINEILRAAEKIKQEHPNIIFRLIGIFDEEYGDKIQRYVSSGVITYIPWQDNIHPFIMDSHAILHASYHEGMSNTLLEAASMGRPVIATDVHGCIETFEPDVTGIAFKAKDTESLVNAIEKFLALTHEKRVEMGKAGREKMVREFNRNLVVGKYIKEIEKISEEN